MIIPDFFIWALIAILATPIVVLVLIHLKIRWHLYQLRKDWESRYKGPLKGEKTYQIEREEED